MKRVMMFPFDPLLSEGSWIVAAVDDPLFQPVEQNEIEWNIELPADPGVWVPFHLQNDEFRVMRSEF